MVTTRAKFKKKQNTLKTMVGSNDDLLIEILRRLPAKSIIRFKYVSKHWQTLLSQQYFTILIDSLSTTPGYFFHKLYIPIDVKNPSIKRFRSLEFYHYDPFGTRIVQSCNGLLVCCSDNSPESSCKHYVFNPTTKQFAVIPPLIGSQDIRINIRFMGLAYHLSLEVVGSNDDLLIEILRRLPAKSIIRFKSVSKHWQTLLSQRYFTLLFDSLSISPGFFLHNLYIPLDVENQSTKPFRSLEFYHNDPLGIRIVQSCNGLLLCCTDKGTGSTGKYYVFNPTTKQFAVIPPLIGNQDYSKDIRLIGLAFHHTDCVHYKVVCVYPADSIPNPYREWYQIRIYSSDTGTWRILRDHFHLSLSFSNLSYGVYWNGVIYCSFCCEYLFYFILDSERMQKLPLPENGGTSHSLDPFYITESRGHLHLAETTSKNGYLHIKVYEMLSDHSAWVFKYQVEHLEFLAVSDSARVFSYNCCDFRILDVIRGENEEDTFMLVKIPWKIMKYNIRDKSFKPIFDISGFIPNFGLKAYRYIESLGSF